jgi:multimeric flavodoxin WrbA
MKTAKRVVGIVGSYRKLGFIDSAVEEVLSATRNLGAETEKIYLLDQHIEFCTNCRTCLQTSGTERGQCILDDDMNNILEKIEGADCLVIGAPVNFGNVNALTQKFLERCIGYYYWPWEKTPWPKKRKSSLTKQAVLVSSSAAPGWFSRLTFGAMRSLKILAKTLGAKPVGTLLLGILSREKVELSERIRNKARFLGKKLVA